MKKLSLFLLSLLSLNLSCTHENEMGLYEKKIFVKGKATLPYRILYPINYDKNKSYPVLVFLHGGGAIGRDNEVQLKQGGELFLKEENRRKFPAIIMFPQCPPDSSWSQFWRVGSSNDYFFPVKTAPVPQLMVKEFLDQMVSNKVADSSRIYIGGLSLGAFGTYDMLIRYPHFFAAAFTICGAADIPQYTKEASHIPLWIFHGARDKTVPPETDRQLYKALKERGAKDVLYTEYEGVEHRSWHNAFAEPELLKWLFSKRKN